MKKIIGLVIILAVLIVGSYYVTGLITERTLKKDINIINQSNGLFVDIQQYDRGWFTSTAQLKWQMHIPERVVKTDNGQTKTVPAQDYTLDMPLKIYHGPVMIADTVRFGLGYAYTKLTLPETYYEQFGQYFTAESTKPELKISVLVNYFNKSHFRVNVLPFKLITKEDNAQFEWLGMISDVAISSNLKNVDGEFTIEGLIFHKDDTTARLGQVSSDYEMSQTKSGLYIGEASLNFPSFEIAEKENIIFDLKKLYLHTSSDIEDGLFSSYFKASLDKIVANGKTYGPGRLEMSIKNLDAEVMAKINEQVNKLQDGSDQERQQALLALAPDLPKLFAKGAEFSISELSFTMPEGVLKGNLLFSLPKGESDNPFQLIQKVEGDGKLRIPAEVLRQVLVKSAKEKLMQQPDLPGTESAGDAKKEQIDEGDVVAEESADKQVTVAEIEQKAKQQTDQKLENLVQSGVLQKKEDAYIIEMKLANGQLLINGKPFNMDMFKF